MNVLQTLLISDSLVAAFPCTLLSTSFLIVIVEVKRNLGEHMVTVIWRGLASLGNIIHPLNNSISFLAEGMCKSEKIWVACGTNAIEIRIVTFKSIACMVESTCHHCQQDEQHSKASPNQAPTKN